MWYVGLDVHAKLTAVCILDENGKKFKSFIIKAPIASVPSILAKLEKPFAVVYEASSGYGWLYDHLVAIGQTVRVAHPGKLRLIFRSKRKNDRLDAEKLAKLLSGEAWRETAA